MDKQDFLKQVIIKVYQKLDELGENVSPQEIASFLEENGTDKILEREGTCKPGLLILSSDHGDFCHEILESEALKEKYEIKCALLEDNKIDINQFEAVALFRLTNRDLSKIANGIGDSPFTEMAVDAITRGKHLFVCRDEIELYQRNYSIPKSYFRMLENQLILLCESGLIICGREEMEKIILKSSCEIQGKEESVQEQVLPVMKPEKEMTFTKRVVTERDVLEAVRSQVTCIHLKNNTILTDLAKDAARKQDIRFVRN